MSEGTGILSLSFVKCHLHFQDTDGGIFPGGHPDPNGIAYCRGRRMDDIELIGSGVVAVGGVKLERFPLSILLDFERPVFRKLDIALPAVHPEDADAAQLLRFAKPSDDPLGFARLTSAGPASDFVTAK